MRVLIRRAAVVAGAAAVLFGSAVGVARASGTPTVNWSASGTFSYGTLTPGATSTPQAFKLTNSGGVATSALKITLTPSLGTPSSAFAKTTDTCTGTSLGPNKSCSVTVTYTAPATGQTDQATLQVTSNKPPVIARVTLVGASKAHQPPVLANVETGTLQYDAGTPPVPVTSTLTVSSPDATTLAGATVSITSGLAAAEDSLGFTNQNGITGSYNAATGVLTLTGTASVATYQAALRSVTYSDANGTTPSTGPRTVSFQVDDGNATGNLSNVASRTVNVNPNSPPAAVNDSASTDYNTAIDINVLANDTDPDGDVLMVQSVNTTGTKGLVSINADGTIHYDPNGQFNNLTTGQTATDTFTYTVSDGFFTSTATVTVTINGT